MALLFLVYKVKNSARTMMLAQVAATIVIPASLVLMICSMFALSWVYASIVGTGGIFLMAVDYAISRRIKDTLPTPRYVRRLAAKFGVGISILKWRQVTAFAYKGRVFLSENLLHKLELGEIRAVIAHEAYHARSGHSRMMASFLGITSLTFVHHRGEEMADRFAATVVGIRHLENALSKLEIAGREKRIAALRQAHIQLRFLPTTNAAGGFSPTSLCISNRIQTHSLATL
jgi:Zn-dependent protease with chaperone function